MKKLYQIEVQICGTIYVKGDNPVEANGNIMMCLYRNRTLDVRGDGISGLMFDDPELPKCSLSPAMTVHGIWPDAGLEEAG